MGRAAAILLALALGLASAFLVACGDRNNLIPPSNASAINEKLDSVASAVAASDCGVAGSAINSAELQAQSLPSKVDAKLRKTLQDNLEHVASRAQTQCTKSTTPSTQSTNTTPTTVTRTETTNTETTNTENTTTQPPPTNTSPPPNTGSTDTGQSGGVGPGGGGNGGQRSPQD